MSMSLKLGKMYRFIGKLREPVLAPAFVVEWLFRPIGWICENDIVVCLGEAEDMRRHRCPTLLLMHVLTADGVVGWTPYRPEFWEQK
jgi:hypothetical protein